MTMQETLRGSQLNAIANATPSAHEITLALAERRRLRHFSDISRLRTQLVRAGKQIVEKDYMAFWQNLEGLGVGALVFPRNKKNAIRFEWHYNLKSISKAMMGDLNEKLEKLSDIAPKPPTKAAKASVIKSEPAKRIINKTQARVIEIPGKFKMLVILNGGREVQIDLPGDLKKDEAKTICENLIKASA